MKFKNLHPWQVNPKKAVEIQKRLRNKIILKNKISKIKTIAAADVAFDKNRAFAAVVILSFPDLKLIEKVFSSKTLSFPYIPGLLTFREGPVLLNAFKKLKTKPDLILFDGQGIAHPRRMGIATHMGIILDKPAIGCAKSFLFGAYSQPAKNKGAHSYIKDKDEILGVALRTKDKTNPIFVSCGHKINLNTAIKVVLALSKFRIPEPIRIADQFSKKMQRDKQE